MTFSPYDYTPEEEEEVLRRVTELSNQTRQYVAEATQGQSDAIAELMVAVPDADPAYVTAAAMAIDYGVWTPDEAVNFVADTRQAVLDQQTRRELEQEAANQQSGVRSKIYSGFKGVVRWAGAGLQTVEQLATSALMRGVYEGITERQFATDPRTGERMPFQTLESPLGVERTQGKPTSSWTDIWETTDIAHMLRGVDAGEGFFVGEDSEVRKRQRDEAIAYRGSIVIPEGDQEYVVGMTPGRAVSSFFSEPKFAPVGADTYNNLSGVIDALWALGMPSGAEVAGPALRTVGEGGAALTKGQYRSLNGLTNSWTPWVRSERVASFLDSNAGTAFSNKVLNINTIEEARRLMPNASARVWNRIVTEATDDVSVRRVLSETLGAERGAMATNEINWRNWSGVKQTVMRNGIPKLMGVERGLTRQPGRKLIVGFASDAEITETVKNSIDWFKLIYADEAKRTAAINRFTNALLNDKADVDNIVKDLEDIFVDAMGEKGIPKEFMRGIFTRHINDIAEVHKFNALDDVGAGALYDMAFRKMLFEDDETGQIFSGIMDRASGYLDSEHRRWTIEMPDPRAVANLTKKYNWMWARRARNKAGKMVDNPPLPKEFLDEAGKPRVPAQVVDFLHNQLWKRGALATGGYASRIAVEGAVRQMFAPGIRSGVMHPWEFISSLMFRGNSKFVRWANQRSKYLGSIEGDVWSEGLELLSDPKAETLFNDHFDEIVDSVGGGMRAELDPGVMHKAGYKMGSWSEASRNSPDYVQGVADNIHLLANDRLSRLVANGYTADDIIELARQGDKTVLSALQDFQTRHSQRVVTDWATGKSRKGSLKIFNPSGDISEYAVRNIIDGYIVPRIDTFTLGDSRLREIIANGDRFGLFTPTGAYDEIAAFLKNVEGMFGSEVRGEYATEFINVIQELLNKNPEGFPALVKYRVNVAGFAPSKVPKAVADLWSVYEKFTNKLFGQVLTRPDQFLNRSPVWRRFYHQGIDLLLPQLDEGEAIKIVENVREAFLRPLLRERSRWSSLKPNPAGQYKLGKKIYTKAEVDAKIAAVDTKLKAAQFTDGWAGRYVGSRDVWDRIVAMADGDIPATGTRTVEEISELARGFAADQTSKLLYDAAERNNLAAAGVIVSPFLSAWAEGIKFWPKSMLKYPQETRKMLRSFQGLADADPDNNGLGIFYQHPTTGEMVFDYPTAGISAPTILALTGFVGGSMVAGPIAGVAAGIAGGISGYKASQAASASGVDVAMSAPLRSMNVALQVSPGLGPIAQFGAAWVLDRNWVPKSDDIARVLLPYGPPAGGIGGTLLPSWFNKFTDLFQNDPNQANYYSDFKIQAFDALYMTGRYDRFDDQSMADLVADAEAYAKYLLVLRTTGQFVGAARPTVELKIPTRFEGQITIDDVEMLVKEGDIRNVVLSRAFRLLQEEDYSTAVMKFLEMFGDESLGFVIGKTYTDVDGLQASRDFGDWELSNQDIVKGAPEVFPYFAGDVGTVFDFYTWGRQLRTGSRGKWTDPIERLEAAEAIVGRSLYMYAVKEAGAQPNPLREEALREYRTFLEESLPGFKMEPMYTNIQEIQIQRLQNALELDATADNAAANGMREYFTYRDEMIRIANARRVSEGRREVDEGQALRGDANADLRAVLRIVGFGLTQTNPEFSRVWSDVLFTEVDF